MPPASPDQQTLRHYQRAATPLLLWQFRFHARPMSSRPADFPDAVESLREGAGAPRGLWPDWMPGEAPANDFSFD